MKFKNSNKNFLSNYYNSKFTDSFYSNLKYDTMEHYFSSMKYFIPKTSNYYTHVNNILNIKDPSEIEIYTKAYPYLCSNFCNIKDIVMKNGLLLKFNQNSNLKQKLLNINGKIEADIDDEYWGLGKTGKGKNKLGLLLEEVRDELKF
jgi:N-glycosidase YbiA